MRWFAGVIIALLLIIGLSPANAAPSYSDSIRAWWDLDEPSGVRADSGPHALDLSPVGSVGQSAGMQGSALSLSSSVSSANRASDTLLVGGDSSYSFTTWARITSLPSTVPDVFGRYTCTTANRDYRLFYEVASSRWRWAVYNSTSNVNTTLSVYATAAGAASLNTWYFIYVGYDHSSATVTISVNGVANSVTGTRVPDGYGTTYVSTCTFEVGQAGAQSTTQWYGQIDQLVAWNRTLAPDEIAYLYNSGAGRSRAEILAYAAPTATPTATPTTTPSPIPTVQLALSTIISDTATIATQQVAAWSIGSATFPIFMGITSIIMVFGVLFILQRFIPHPDEIAEEEDEDATRHHRARSNSERS